MLKIGEKLNKQFDNHIKKMKANHFTFGCFNFIIFPLMCQLLDIFQVLLKLLFYYFQFHIQM